MIRLDISTALFFYLLLNVSGVLVLWAFVNPKAKTYAMKQDKDYVWHCSICANVYIDSKNEEISKCPQCGSYNKKSEWKGDL